MNILILGYGKMGKEIEKIALERGHQIAAKIDRNNAAKLNEIDTQAIDIAIEFSQPESAFDNISFCLKNNIPVVVGTTGWLDRREEVHRMCEDNNGMFFYASNFSVGVNLFFKLNQMLARLMEPHAEYEINMEEVHHIHKKDAPSGTAITLAEDLMNEIKRKKQWELAEKEITSPDSLPIKAIREDEVPGTHIINYFSDIDSIEIKHTAHSRKGFAMGAVLASEWAADKKGILGMDDFLKL